MAIGNASLLAPTWQDRLLEQNRAATRAMLGIVLLLYPLFGVLDYFVAPHAWLWLLWGSRIVVTLATVAMFPLSGSQLFDRHPHWVTSAYMLLCSLGIAIMIVIMGGLASTYYAGLSLAMVATGLLFVWPERVVITTHVAIVAMYFVPNLLLGQLGKPFDAFANSLFLGSTALIVVVGQIFNYRSEHHQYTTARDLEETRADLQKAKEHLEQLDEFKSQLFANITHELRTPLAMILAPIEMMMQGDLGPMTETAEKTLASMLKSGTKLLKLINDLLDLSKLEASRLQLYVEEHDMRPWLQGLVDQVVPLAQRKDIELHFEPELAAAPVFVDIERIERVFVNLLSNAVKFTPPQGRVVVRLRGDAERLHVLVEDSGEGFAPEQAERLFERFYQVDMGGTRKFGGTGIGLSLARELVELHGGKIWAEGRPGEGATFHVELICGRDHLPADALGREDGETDLSTVFTATAAMPRSEGYRLLDIAEVTERRVVERDIDEHERSHTVLIVEDTPDVTRIIHLALRRDFKVMAAPDGLKGLELALKYRPDLIITDLMMPGIDGLELVRRLRADAATAHTPIIMLTARGALEDRVQGIESGVNTYLQKPFSARELQINVRALLGLAEKQADRLLEGRMDSLETIAGGLAHEINNPLNYIQQSMTVIEGEVGKVRSAIDKLQSGAALSAREQQQLEKAAERTARMFNSSRAGVERIAKAVALMRRYSREGYARVAQPISLGDAIADVAALVGQAVGAERPVLVEVEGHPQVEAVPEELHQVLTNLIQNALEAVAAHPEGQVTVRAADEGDEVVLTVRDNGPGMDAETRDRVFSPFFSTKGPGRGMGMGLTITWRVVRALGGKIAVDSEAGVGTMFTVRLPAARPAAAA
ncbi:MAG: response regulator [Deltaproteobacteria bacterium]|nr:response regulator [Deltaproteobacteria bacterium]